ncbi:MAG: NADH-quinone oxidoreductase subunit C [Elusimicrobia bacterium]|nr:NADH-quinone oxidoreductase subunit C [Candidatus Obscuribacterium magneticum]
MYSTEIIKKLQEEFPEVQEIPVPEKFVRDPLPHVNVPPQRIHEVGAFLKSDPAFAFDLPNYVTAVDKVKDGVFELVYDLYSTRHKQGIVLKSTISRDNGVIDSLSDIWSGFDWQEREVYDLFGITFRHHPNMKRILLWEGYPGHPLRKDYVHVTDRFDSGLEIGTPGFDEAGLPVNVKGGSDRHSGESRNPE